MRGYTLLLQSMLMILCLVQAKYTYHPHQDCAGGDMILLQHRTVDELKAFCDITPKCLGFNTEGYIKSILSPMKTFYRQSSQGMYIKQYEKVPIPSVQGYTFHQGKDSHGQDIIELSGHSIYEMKEFCDKHVACRGFSTRGWIKKGIAPSTNWHTYSMQPEDGLYVKDGVVDTPTELEGYTFLRGQDYKGDAESMPILLQEKTLAELKTFCDSMPDCVGFNTDGYVASSKKISMFNSKRFSTPKEGFFKKNQRDNLFEDAYIFHPGKSYSDFNLIQLRDKSLEVLRAYCDKMTKCVAFDSLGNLKTQVPDQGLWREWTTSQDRGLYIKRQPAKAQNTEL